jgi:hypothetical protein
MKSRILFRENGSVIRTRHRWRDALHTVLLALLVCAVILLLPGLLGGHDIDAGPADANAQYMADIEAAFAAGMHAGLAQRSCRRGEL